MYGPLTFVNNPVGLNTDMVLGGGVTFNTNSGSSGTVSIYVIIIFFSFDLVFDAIHHFKTHSKTIAHLL